MKKNFMSNKWAKKNDRDISRPYAICMSVLCLFMTVVFTNTFFSNIPIKKTDAVKKTAVFDCYEMQYGRHASITYAELFFENGDKEHIRGVCVNNDLKENLETIKKGTKLHILINPNNNYIVELKTDEKEMLDFDYAQKKLWQQAVGNLYFAIFMLLLCIYFIYKSITTKERITKEDIKFYWDIMRKK